MPKKEKAGFPPSLQILQQTPETRIPEKPLYRVVGWLKNFENNRSKELKTARWFPHSNSFDDDKYTQLAEHASADRLLGALDAILKVASRGEPRGTLVRENGDPHDAKSLARVSRLSVGLFEFAIPPLLEIGYLEIVPVAQPPATSPQGTAGISRTIARKEENELNGRDGTGTEVKGPDQTEERPEQARESPSTFGSGASRAEGPAKSEPAAWGPTQLREYQAKAERERLEQEQCWQGKY